MTSRQTKPLGVPCLTLRENTERPITITRGTNRLTGPRPESILSAFHEVRDNPRSHGRVLDLWDGHAAECIVKCLLAVS